MMRSFVRSIKKGMIILWYGSIASIPSGWQLCNGTNGSPDMDAKWVKGAGVVQEPLLTGGASSHDHAFTAEEHDHGLYMAPVLGPGSYSGDAISPTAVVGTTDIGYHIPPYRALCFIMKL